MREVVSGTAIVGEGEQGPALSHLVKGAMPKKQGRPSKKDLREQKEKGVKKVTQIKYSKKK